MSRLRWLCCLVAVPAVMYAQAQDARDIVVPAAIPNTVSIRALGMGKVSVVGIEGSQTIFSNPAGLATMDKTSVALGGRLEAGLIKSEMDEATDPSSSSYISPHGKFTHIAGGTVLNFPNYPYTIGFGVGYQTAYDMGRNTYTEIDRGTGLMKTTTKISGGLNTISPSVALGLNKKYALGVTLHKSIIGELKSEVKTEPAGNQDEPTTFDGDAFFATFGGLAKPIKPLAIGLSYSTGFTWDFGGETITMPWQLALGGQYQVLEKLALAAEFQTRMLGELTRDVTEKFKNGFAARLGVEYFAGSTALRLGGFVESVPRGDLEYIIVGSEPDISNPVESAGPKPTYGATVGSSIPVGKATIDLALQWNRFGRDETVTLGGTEVDKYSYSENVFRIDAGLTLSFGAISPGAKQTVVPDSLTPELMEEPGQRRPHY